MNDEKQTAWSAVSIRPVPADIAQALEAQGFKPERCVLCVDSRVLPDGRYGESWLAVGDERLAVVSRNGHAPEASWTARLDEVKGASTQKVTGGGVLVVNVSGKPQEVLRYDAGHAPLFGEVAQRIQRHVAPPKKDGKDAKEEKEEKEPQDKKDDAAGAAPATATEAKAPAQPLEFKELLAKQRELTCPSCLRLYPKNTKVCPFCVKRGSTIRRVMGFAKPFRGKILLMAFLMVTGTALHMIEPQIVRVLVDDVIGKRNAGMLLPMIGLMGLLMFVNYGISIWRGRLGIWVGAHVTNEIQGQAFAHLQRLSLSYFNKQQTGALMSRVNNDARQLQGFLTDGIQFTVINVLMVIGVTAMLLWMNPLLGLMLLIPMPVVVFLSALIWKKIHRRFRLLWNAISAATAYLNDALSGVRVIKAFGKEGAEVERFNEKIDYSRDSMIDAEQTWQTLVPVLNMIIHTSLLLVWYFGAQQIFGDPEGKTFTLGSLMAYIAYLGMVYGPLQLLTRLNDWLSRSLTAAARVFEILDVEPEISDRPDAKPLPDVKGEIEMRNVTFGYEKHTPVLKNVSLTIKPGEMIGLVGPSGAGKSTFINLVGRLFDVDDGAILVDGHDIREVKTADLRRQVGYVLQDTFLFSGTVAENIAYARPGATKDEIIEAAVAANAHGFIMKLPDGYDTYLGERGTRVSGGERQRIAIARAILHNPRILILDEATSSVDTETEARIQIALGALVKGRTTIAIAHRLSTLRHADRLVVVKDGEVLEQGSHAELMAKEGGEYRKLVNIQTEWSRTIAVGG